MASFHFPHFTPTALLYLLLLPSPILALNITALLSAFPDLSDFSSLLSSSSVAADLSRRSSVTLLAVPNSFLASSSSLTGRLPPSSVADVLRYHVLLQYLSLSDLRQIPPSGKIIATLFQTTGRATGIFGSVNVTCDSDGVVSIRSPAPFSSPSNATILSPIEALPYNVSIFTVDSVLVPFGFDLTASETRPPPVLNITKALIDGHNFNVAASMLMASGVVDEFEKDEGGAGITLFVPTDLAFANLPATVRLQSLPADKKAVVLRFHVLHSYYPLGSLESIVNPVQPTLATEHMGAGSFTLNISRGNDSVAINTGIVQATVTQTVFDQKPVAIFGVSKVLLPREIFGSNPVKNPPGGDAEIEAAQSPVSSPSPWSLLGVDGPSSTPGFREEIGSGCGGNEAIRRILLSICCIGLYVMIKSTLNKNINKKMETQKMFHELRKQASFFFKEKMKIARLALTDVTPAQLMTEEATDGNLWAPDSRILGSISRAAFEVDDYWRIVDILHKRFLGFDKKSWRVSYNSLIVLERLLTHGPESAAKEFQGEAEVFKDMASFQYIDDKGFNWGLALRKKCERVLKLLEMGHFLTRERDHGRKVTRGIKGFGTFCQRCSSDTDYGSQIYRRSNSHGPLQVQSCMKIDEPKSCSEASFKENADKDGGDSQSLLCGEDAS